MGRVNLHATVVVVGACGVLIRGPSGAGKSALALRLVELARQRQRFAMLVADDQVWITSAAGRLIAKAPDPIAGLIEQRGYGPVRVPHEAGAVVDRVVTLVDRVDAPRLHPGSAAAIAQVRLPELRLAGHGFAAAAAVMAWLEDREPTSGP